MECDYCGEEKDDVKPTLDTLEIYDEEIPVNLCQQCYCERHDEI